MTTIHAAGTAEQHILAERATIAIGVSVSSRDRSTSIEAATNLHNRTVARIESLRSHGDATWHSANALSTWSYKTYEEGKAKKVPVIEYRTVSRIEVKLSNLSLVGSLTTEFAEAGLTTNVSWSITEVTRRRAERDMRKAAVEKSREVANDYAEALGRPIVKVVSISDKAEGAVAPLMATARAGAVAKTPEVTIQEITVSSTVHGVYETD